MKKIIAIGITLVVLVAMVSYMGCTEPEQPPADDGSKVTNQQEADSTLNDISTDLSGITNSLDEIDDTLTQ